MHSPDSPAPVYPGDKVLEELRRFLNDGRALDAWHLTKGLAPLGDWVNAGPLPAFYAARLYGWLGSQGRSNAIDRVAQRKYPESAEVFLRSLNVVGRRKGPLAALQLIRDRDRHPPLEDRHRFFLVNLEASYWAHWSDFDRAFACLDEAERLRPGHDRTLVNRAEALRRADRRQEAEIFVREAMRSRPGNVGAPRILSDLLRAAGREDEARRVLEDAMERVQDADIALALANWHTEHGHYAEALRLSEEYEKLVPLADHAARGWLAGWRAFRHYLAKDYPAALKQASLSPKCFIAEIADRLHAAELGHRVRLEVPFVKQDRRTCGPATLAAICRFHGDPAEHVEIAEAICYDGTPDHSERHWAEQRGYAVREFQVTPDTLRALIDRALPFTLTTVEPASAHLQAVIGYDTKADTLLVREPGWADDAEYRMGILDEYAFSGPRGMVLVPQEKRALLEEVTLPEAELYDFLHQLQRALHANLREQAIGFLEQLRAAAPGHRLTLLAERRLAHWDRNVPGQLNGVDRMLALFPEQPALLYEKLWLLAATAGRQEQMAFARRLQLIGKAPPEVDRMLAELLDDDAREWPSAERAWQRTVRRSGFQSSTLSGLADFRWSQLRRREALLYYRLAACVDVMAESVSRCYFSAARWVGASEGAECFEFLRSRVKRFGALSGGPARTLAWALGQMKCDGEALDVIEEAVRLRPDEGDLLLVAADYSREAGRLERAAELVALAENRVPDGAWLRHKARDAVSAADLPLAMGFYRRLLEIEPASHEVHESLAELLAGTGGRAAAVAHLEEVCATYPGHASLHVSLCGWLEDDLARRDVVLGHLLVLDPADGWARRELAIDLKKQGRHTEAVQAAREALAVAPNTVASPGILAGALRGAGQLEEARECLRTALRLDADYVWGISELISLAPDLSGKQAELAWILTELEKQVTNGEGLMRWHSEAWVLREPSEVLGVLERVKKIRPDLWQTWSVLSLHLADMGRMDQALTVAEAAAGRFPFLPRIWYDVALIRSRGGDMAGEREALEQALHLSPRWEQAVRRMATVCRNMDDAAAARSVLEQHSRSSPLDGGVMLDLVRLLRDEGDAAATRGACRRAVSLAPLSQEAWALRASLAADDAEESVRVRAEAAALTMRLPHSLAAWECRMAVAAAGSGYSEELGVLDEALAALPGSWDLLDRKALVLAESAQYEAALACCAPDKAGVTQERWRKARAADILYRQGRESEAIQQMEELAEQHPDYMWPVQLLVEWHDHREDQEAVLRWTTRQTRLNPGQPGGWGYQAGALLSSNRTEEAEAALRTAVALEPGYTWAVRQLLGLELKRGDMAAADRTVARVRGRIPIHTIAELFTTHGQAELAETFCRSAVELNAKDAASQEALGEALWTLGRRQEALAAWTTALQLKPERRWLAGHLYEKAVEAGGLHGVSTELHDWAAIEPASAERWTAWVTFLEKDGASPEPYLTALAEAARRLPDRVEFADRLATRLCMLRRYTEALEVCASQESQVLMRRRAWIEGERGNRTKAIELMAAALQQDEVSEFGLQTICDWLEEAGRPEEAIPYATTLIRVAPRAAGSFGYLASALLRCGRKDEAEPHLFRALRMMNDYEWAADQLFDLQMERKDYAAALITLKIVQQHLPGSGAMLKELRLAVGQRDQAAAAKVWQKLITAEPPASAGRMETASGILKKAGWEMIAKAAGSSASSSEQQNSIGPGAYAVWVREEYARKNYGVWKRFQNLKDEAVKIAAWEAYLTAAGEVNDSTLWDDLRKWRTRWAMHQNKDFLRRHTLLWAYGAYFYACCHLHRAGRRWTADWRARSGLETWMLTNVAVLLDGKWSLRRGRQVREWCVANLPADHSTARHRIRLAFLASVEGKRELALNYLSDVREPDITAGAKGSEDRLQLHLARLMSRLLDSGQPIAGRRTAAAAELSQAIIAIDGVLSPALHGNTLRVFLPAALRRAGLSAFLWRLTRLIPAACGLS